MWTDLIVLAAEDTKVITDSSPIIVALISALSAVVVAAIGAAVALARRGSSQPTNTTAAEPRLGERIAVLEDWRHSVRKADDIHDRRLDYAEEALEVVCARLGIPFDPRSRREPT